MIKTFRASRPVCNTPPRKAYNANTAYDNHKWIAASRAFIELYPFCVLCLAYGDVNRGAAEYASSRQRNLIVDHIIRHGNDSERFWDDSNWQTLCRYPCHDMEKSRIEKAGRDWWEYVRGLISERGTDDVIAQHTRWLPPHVWDAIGCPPAGGGRVLTA